MGGDRYLSKRLVSGQHDQNINVYLEPHLGSFCRTFSPRALGLVAAVLLRATRSAQTVAPLKPLPTELGRDQRTGIAFALNVGVFVQCFLWVTHSASGHQLHFH